MGFGRYLGGLLAQADMRDQQSRVADLRFKVFRVQDATIH